MGRALEPGVLDKRDPSKAATAPAGHGIELGVSRAIIKMPAATMFGMPKANAYAAIPPMVVGAAAAPVKDAKANTDNATVASQTSQVASQVAEAPPPPLPAIDWDQVEDACREQDVRKMRRALHDTAATSAAAVRMNENVVKCAMSIAAGHGFAEGMRWGVQQLGGWGEITLGQLGEWLNAATREGHTVLLDLVLEATSRPFTTHSFMGDYEDGDGEEAEVMASDGYVMAYPNMESSHITLAEAAIAHGHANVLDWLAMHLPEMARTQARLTSDACLVSAAGKGHADVLARALLHHGLRAAPGPLPDSVMRAACRGGRTSVVRWLLEQDEDADADAMVLLTALARDPVALVQDAIAYGHVELLDWLVASYSHGVLVDDDACFVAAASKGFVDVLERALVHHKLRATPAPLSDAVMRAACTFKRWRVVRWLLEHDSDDRATLLLSVASHQMGLRHTAIV